METLESEEPDDEFVYFLIGALYQVIYMHKGSPFNEAQTETIENLVHYSLRKENRDRFEYYGNDVKEYGELFFSELRKCRS